MCCVLFVGMFRCGELQKNLERRNGHKGANSCKKKKNNSRNSAIFGIYKPGIQKLRGWKRFHEDEKKHSCPPPFHTSSRSCRAFTSSLAISPFCCCSVVNSAFRDTRSFVFRKKKCQKIKLFLYLQKKITKIIFIREVSIFHKSEKELKNATRESYFKWKKKVYYYYLCNIRVAQALAAGFQPQSLQLGFLHR